MLALSYCLGFRLINYNGIPHSDIKAGNILMNEQMKHNIADFGSALMKTRKSFG
jgi:serine/threonine protein kinase